MRRARPARVRSGGNQSPGWEIWWRAEVREMRERRTGTEDE